MYELKEITLKNGKHQKKRLVINFFDKEYTILAEFLMSDASLLSDELTHAFNDIFKEKKGKINLTGNRCSIEIEKSKTKISDLFEGLNEESYSSLRISTEEFKEYVEIWHQKLINFNKKNKI